jgi:hypothetical protein
MFFANLLVYEMAHCLADTALQPEFMAKGKNQTYPIDMTKVPKGQKPLKLWWHWLTHHAMIHGLAVLCVTYFLTNDQDLAITFAFIETVCHWTIDYYKCKNCYNPHMDQLLHLVSKIFYSLIIW